MSQRRMTPVDDGGAVILYRTDSSEVYISASYKKNQKGKYSLHKFIVRSILVKQFDVTTWDTSNTLPKVQTIQQTSLDDLNEGEKAIAQALRSYLVSSIGLKPTSKTSKHSISFYMIVRSREDPALISKFSLFRWTEKDINTIKSLLKRNSIGNDNFDKYLSALSSESSNLNHRLPGGVINKGSEEWRTSDNKLQSRVQLPGNPYKGGTKDD